MKSKICGGKNKGVNNFSDFLMSRLIKAYYKTTAG